jgi:hypothetical protein
LTGSQQLPATHGKGALYRYYQKVKMQRNDKQKIWGGGYGGDGGRAWSDINISNALLLGLSGRFMHLQHVML